MFTQQIGWLWGLVLVAAWLESCGAMTIETGNPDEPIAAPVRPPRLVRRDAAADVTRKAEDEHP